MLKKRGSDDEMSGYCGYWSKVYNPTVFFKQTILVWNLLMKDHEHLAKHSHASHDQHVPFSSFLQMTGTPTSPMRCISLVHSG